MKGWLLIETLAVLLVANAIVWFAIAQGWPKSWGIRRKLEEISDLAGAEGQSRTADTVIFSHPIVNGVPPIGEGQAKCVQLSALRGKVP